MSPLRTHQAIVVPETDGPIGGEGSSQCAEAGAEIRIGSLSHRNRKPHGRVANGLIIFVTTTAAVWCFHWLYYEGNSPTDEVNVSATTAANSVVASPAAEELAMLTEGDDPPEPAWAPMADSHLNAGGPFASRQSPVPQNSIDTLVFGRLDELDITPAKLCSDEVFLRRIYIDVLGTVPTVEEALRFLDNSDPRKRAQLIDEALQRPEFADYWAMRWCDLLRVKAEFPINLWPNAAQAYSRWVRQAIDDNVPYDTFVVDLLTSSGSNFRTPQVNFWRAAQSKDPEALAQVVALTFLCQRTENWSAERLDGMSVFFSQVGYKPTGEWKEEIVFFDSRTGRADSPHEPLMAVFPGGALVSIPEGHDPRQTFAQWLVNPRNKAFSHAIANRAWYWLMGRGIVDPVDDIRPDNPPSHPELLDHLAEELVSADFDLRHLYRLILNSHAYQLACIPQSDDPRAVENFAYYPTRRLDAEVLIDVICKITETTEDYMSIIPEPFTFLPDGQRAVTLPDGSITSNFLELFGRPSRDTGLESDRNNHLSSGQALHLLNSNHIRDKIKRGTGIKKLLTRSDNVEMLYLAILSRRPTDEEVRMLYDVGTYGPGLDVAWALINSDEFLFRH